MLRHLLWPVGWTDFYLCWPERVTSTHESHLLVSCLLQFTINMFNMCFWKGSNDQHLHLPKMLDWFGLFAQWFKRLWKDLQFQFKRVGVWPNLEVGSRSGSQWERSHSISSWGNTFHLFSGDTKALLSRLKDRISPACPRSASECSPNVTCPEYLT